MSKVRPTYKSTEAVKQCLHHVLLGRALCRLLSFFFLRYRSQYLQVN
uniref:Uncharacterized protein n=1 Tax=Arundo donax TaxID=35708 RepID=A0A0A9A381_ARUDO